MLSRKITNLKGQLQTQVRVMDFKAGRIVYFTLDDFERGELPEELKEYIRLCRILKTEDGMMVETDRNTFNKLDEIDAIVGYAESFNDEQVKLNR